MDKDNNYCTGTYLVFSVQNLLSEPLNAIIAYSSMRANRTLKPPCFERVLAIATLGTMLILLRVLIGLFKNR